MVAGAFLNVPPIQRMYYPTCLLDKRVPEGPNISQGLFESFEASKRVSLMELHGVPSGLDRSPLQRGKVTSIVSQDFRRITCIHTCARVCVCERGSYRHMKAVTKDWLSAIRTQSICRCHVHHQLYLLASQPRGKWQQARCLSSLIYVSCFFTVRL